MLEPTTVARPYARAAFQHAVDQSQVDAWNDALQVLAIAIDDVAVRSILDDPANTAQQRSDAINALLGDSVPAGMASLVSVMSENNRLGLAREVSALFAELKAALDAAAKVAVTSAFDVPDDTAALLSKTLSERLGKTVDMTVEIDPSLLGGAIIKAGDLVIDGSVRGRLHKLSTALKS